MLILTGKLKHLPIFSYTLCQTVYQPTETKRFVPRDPPWITKPITTLLNRKNRLYKNYKKHGYKIEDKDRLDTFRSECHQLIEAAKLNYLKNLGNKVNDLSTSLFSLLFPSY